MPNTYNELTDVFRDFFEDDSIDLSPETTANDIDGWDSLSHAILISAIELKFKIHFSTKEALVFRNVRDLVKSIEEKIKLEESTI